jgi:aryl-alcohol dehydrogenase-like predicted oxidoreductase
VAELARREDEAHVDFRAAYRDVAPRDPEIVRGGRLAEQGERRAEGSADSLPMVSTRAMSDLYAPRAAPRAHLVLGCMNFGKRTPEREAARIVDRALERGIVLFDTANAYGDGESERILGRLLAKRRDRAQIATKVGWWRKEGLRPERVRASLDESLSRLGTDHVDLYYLHVPDHDTPIEATLEGVRDVLASGKARRWGMSNYASWQILEAFSACDRLGVPRPVVAQQMYNLLVRQLDVEYFRFARKYLLHTTVYNPLAGGLLAGRHKADGSTLAGSRFDKNPLYQGRYLTETFFRAVGDFEGVAKEAGISLVELSYAWLAQRVGVDSILVGPGSLEHLDAAIGAVEKPLDEATLARVDAVHRALVGTNATYAR